jgi:hypothetical protein
VARLNRFPSQLFPPFAGCPIRCCQLPGIEFERREELPVWPSLLGKSETRLVEIQLPLETAQHVIIDAPLIAQLDGRVTLNS